MIPSLVVSAHAEWSLPPTYVTDPAKAPARSTWFAEPAKIYDNLYFGYSPVTRLPLTSARVLIGASFLTTKLLRSGEPRMITRELVT